MLYHWSRLKIGRSLAEQEGNDSSGGDDDVRWTIIIIDIGTIHIYSISQPPQHPQSNDN